MQVLTGAPASQLFTFDVYREYFRPKASGSELVTVRTAACDIGRHHVQLPAWAAKLHRQEPVVISMHCPGASAYAMMHQGKTQSSAALFVD